MRHFTSAVILAAGLGSRFSETEKKQFVKIGDYSCIAHTVKAFNDCNLIDEIIIVGDENEVAPCLENVNCEKVVKIVKGGETRQQSALLGFDEISVKSDFVAIHDAARCLVTPDIIEKVVSTAYKHRAATAAHRSEDTVKISDDKDIIKSTTDRNYVWLVQTPQAFNADVYRVAAYMAKKEGIAVTDDCMLCERLGFSVKLVECGRENIKLTTADDRYFAEAILKIRKNRLKG